MLKSMKYEFLKARMGIVIIAFIFTILELAFIIGMVVKSEKMYLISVTALSIFGFVCVFYILVSGILTYSRDLREKSGYLVFMVPMSTYRIIGAKLLMILIESLVFVGLFFLFSFFDISLVLHSFGDATWDDIIDALCVSFQIENRDEIMYFFANLGASVLMGFVFLYTIVTIAYLSISISATVLQNKRGCGILSLLIFAILIFLDLFIEEHIPTWRIELSDPARAFVYLWPSLLFFVFSSAAAFIASSKLLEKRISL